MWGINDKIYMYVSNFGEGFDHCEKVFSFYYDHIHRVTTSEYFSSKPSGNRDATLYSWYGCVPKWRI